MALEAVAITGMGLVSPIGLRVPEAEASLRTGASGIRLYEAPPILKPFAAGAIPVQFEEQFPKLERPFLDRVQHMAILAAREAIAMAGLDQFSDYAERAGLYYGNVNGGTATGLDWFRQLLIEGRQRSRPWTSMAIMGNAGGAQIAIRHKIMGPVISSSSACASSGVSIGEAARAIAYGDLDVAVAGGSEGSLTSLVLGTFDGTRAMAEADPVDPSTTCRPFSKQRIGLVLGEGAAFVVLENASLARERGADILGYLSGYACTNDANHIGMPDSRGQVAALRGALARAGLEPGDIAYINAHATATHGGDVIEAASIREVFGAGPDSAAVSSTKSVHGHLLGAASALECVLTLLAMRIGIAPASAHIGDPDPECLLHHVGPAPRPMDIPHALSFSCGFGGTNAALVLSRTPGRNP
ncbi:MAG TPA: beta-ketoacyl-[acyl-carrier-protein] synthase family protein [Luteimonas sp.]|nr:beta-ketoacyl-[acyl-carrier-protein] synthase family protein [Luteimonas sp.]